MAGRIWTQEELDYLTKHGPSIACKDIAKILGRTTRSVRHKYNELGLEKETCVVGDVVKGWEIIDIYITHDGNTHISMAKVKSTLGCGKTSVYKLTQLNKGKVGWPDRRRPDVTKKNTTHGLSDHRLFSIWNGMKARCIYKSQRAYKNYGAKGIRVCEEWLVFDNFYNWAMKNGYSDELSIDRKDNLGNYCPENCRWATTKEQSDNRSVSINITAWGETKNANNWSLDSRCKCTYNSLIYRLREAGWKPEDAISTPSKRGSSENFRCFKQFYDYVSENHPNIIEDFKNQR